MIKQIPDWVDLSKLCLENFHVNSTFELNQFEHFSALLCDNKGLVAVELHFSQERQSFPLITGKVSVDVQLNCQRCGEPVSCVINAAINWRPVKTDHEAAAVLKKFDPIVTGGEPVNIKDLIEEELLLNLPMIPKHEADQCRVTLPLLYK